jgi:hypothetical protein
MPVRTTIKEMEEDEKRFVRKVYAILFIVIIISAAALFVAGELTTSKTSGNNQLSSQQNQTVPTREDVSTDLNDLSASLDSIFGGL